jgi:hypothetical protein
MNDEERTLDGGENSNHEATTELEHTLHALVTQASSLIRYWSFVIRQ